MTSQINEMPMKKKEQPALLESITPDIGQSFTFKVFEDLMPNHNPVWHYHPEIELVYIKHGRGKRHIGSHISYYKEGDLLLIGSKLPHFGFTDRLSKAGREIIIQSQPDIMGVDLATVPEMYHVFNLLQLSKQGLSFYGNTKEYIGHRLEEMMVMNAWERLVAFLQILQYLAHSQEYMALNAGTVTVVVNHQDHERIRTIYRYVREHFMDGIQLADVAQLVSLTEPSFSRYFKKMTGKTFTSYLNEFRIVHACKLLAEQDSTVATIAMDCGFHNFSHFSRTFRKYTGNTPKAYRAELGGRVVD